MESSCAPAAMRQVCGQHQIELHFVRFDEDIGKRADELVVCIKAKRPE